MEKFLISGGRPLKGTIQVRGSKNAATPILAACLLTQKKCIIDNLPLIEDVFRMIEVLKSIGVEIEWLAERKIMVLAKDIDPKHINQDIVHQLRSSVLLLGALLARFDKLKIASPGGCMIGARPLDTHFDALQTLGIKIKQTNNFYNVEKPTNQQLPKTREVVLREFSVTATENTMMAAALMPGKTVINIAACEPHVQELANFLNKMGARIKGAGTHTIEIQGVKRLAGASHILQPDSIEAGTFVVMVLATRGQATIRDVPVEHMALFFKRIKEMGASFEIKGSRCLVKPSAKLKAAKIQTLPYPGLPTDLQAPLGVLCTQAEGTSLIHDPMYEGRLKYIDELNKMGANSVICDPHRALITGPTPLYGTKIQFYDLRAGATLIIAALLAKGRSEISDVYQVDRGYERIEERLQELGADIKRVNA